MNCEKVINAFLELDQNRRIPLAIRFHILRCEKCRNEIFELRRKFESMKGQSAYNAPEDIADLVMMRIDLLEIDYQRNAANARWLTSGAVIFASIFLISFSDWEKWMGAHSTIYFDLMLYSVLGLALTVHAVLFIATHLVYLKKLAEKMQNHGRLSQRGI